MEREIILSLVASATLSDNMGDVWDDLRTALKKIGEEELANADIEYELPELLAQRGIKTIYGTSLSDD